MTIAEMLASGMTVEEITKLAEAEQKKLAKPSEVDKARAEVITAFIKYMSLVDEDLGKELDAKVDEIEEALKDMEELIEITIKYIEKSAKKDAEKASDAVKKDTSTKNYQSQMSLEDFLKKMNW